MNSEAAIQALKGREGLTNDLWLQKKVESESNNLHVKEKNKLFLFLPTLCTDGAEPNPPLTLNNSYIDRDHWQSWRHGK
jgi:hypothetical protein